VLIEESDATVQARLRSAEAQHPAKLNFGDRCARARPNLPLLFKGVDFIHTDIRPALKPA
jgi:ribonuclease VapC